jgi:aspartate carbamoyltransferase catalytic subunit
VVAPPTLIPSDYSGWPVQVRYDLDDVLATEHIDALMMLRVQAERMNESFFPHEREYSQIWGLTSQRFESLAPETLIMHPGPMNRGLEISSTAADSPQSTVLEQVHNGVAVRMATLYFVLTGEKVISQHD